jgi:peptidyl-prolyl cis-trans isomerase D
MLQFIRSKAGSFAVKILFVLLIASFGVWGIGDFLRQGSNDVTIITVGGTKIESAEIQQAMQREIARMRQMFGADFDLAQAKQLGVVSRVTDTLVTDALLDREARRQDLVVGQKQILAEIEREPAFHNPSGQFDKQIMIAVLAQNNLTEQQYAAQLVDGTPRRLAAGPALGDATAPKTLVDWLYKIRNEQRVADFVRLDNAGVKDGPPPDDAAIQSWYDKHHAAFTAPEYRGFTALSLQPSDVSADITITDQQIADAYKERIKDFTKPEKRHILQMTLPDEKTADAAADQLAAGKDFLAVAKDLAKQDADTVDLGFTVKADVPGIVGDTAFATAEGAVSKPFKASFGWSLVKVTGIDPGGVKTLDEAKPALEAELRKDAEAEALDKLANKVQDAVSAGAEIGQIAEQFKLKPFTVAASDAAAKAPDGKPVEGFPVDSVAILKTVFETPEGQVSGIQEIQGGNAYYLVRTDKIIPAALRPLDTVKDAAKTAILADRRRAAREAQVKALADAVTPDNPLAKLATAQKLPVQTTKPFLRTATDTGLPASLVAKLFELEPGKAITGTDTDGAYAVQLKEVKPADPAADINGPDQLSQQLAQQMGGDLLDGFTGALKQRYPVEIRQAALDRLFAGSGQ